MSVIRDLIIIVMLPVLGIAVGVITAKMFKNWE